MCTCHKGGSDFMEYPYFKQPVQLIRLDADQTSRLYECKCPPASLLCKGLKPEFSQEGTQIIITTFKQFVLIKKESLIINHAISMSVAIDVYQIRMHIHPQVAGNCFPHQFMAIIASYFDCFMACFSCTVKQQRTQ